MNQAKAGVPKRKTSKDFPLWLHTGRGLWCRKIKGQFHYFGSDKEQALNLWLEEKDYLLAGKKPPRLCSTPKLTELANVFHAAYQKKVEQGELSQRHLDGCKSSIDRLIAIVGPGCRIDTLEPLDFDEKA